MSRVRSMTVLFGFVALCAVVSFAAWNLVWQPPLPALWRLLVLGAEFGGMFGSMAWALLTVPDKVPRNDGWRKYRFLMWWSTLALLFEVLIVLRGTTFDFWQDFLPVVGLSLALTTIGWALGSLRSARMQVETEK